MLYSELPETYLNSLFFLGDMKIIVTIPAYNEEKTIGKVIKDINQVMSENKFDFKVIVVNDGSRDKTVRVWEAETGKEI